MIIRVSVLVLQGEGLKYNRPSKWKDKQNPYIEPMLHVTKTYTTDTTLWSLEMHL